MMRTVFTVLKDSSAKMMDGLADVTCSMEAPMSCWQLFLRYWVITEGPHFFDFSESRKIVEEKEENFQHSGRESRILENIARLGGSVALVRGVWGACPPFMA